MANNDKTRDQGQVPNETDLVFESSVGSPDLVFGDVDSTQAEGGEHHSGRLYPHHKKPDALEIQSIFEVSFEVNFTESLDPLNIDLIYQGNLNLLEPKLDYVDCYYDNAVSRPLVHKLGNKHQRAKYFTLASSMMWEWTLMSNYGTSFKYQIAKCLSIDTETCHQYSERLLQNANFKYQKAKKLANSFILTYDYGLGVRWSLHPQHQQAKKLALVSETLIGSGFRLVTGGTYKHQQGKQLALSVEDHAGLAKFLAKAFPEKFQLARKLRGIIEAIEPIIPPHVETCYTPNPHLKFEVVPLDKPNLVFKCDWTPWDDAYPDDPDTPDDPDEPDDPITATIVIPIKDVYMTETDIKLYRGTEEIPLLSMDIRLDKNSWAYGFSLTTVPAVLNKLLPKNPNEIIELTLIVNGTKFKVNLDSVQRSRAFNSSTVTMSGRSPTALLGQPYAPTRTFDFNESKTAQQFIRDSLTENGIPIGFELKWDIQDWLIPANTYAVTGKYIDVVSAIATASGSFIKPHEYKKEITIQSRYKYPYWDWNNAPIDIEIPEDVILHESISWKESPDYNGVYIMGQENGIIGYVRRIGTAGTYLAPQVVDPLITHVDVARLRGIKELCNTGKYTEMNLSLPVLKDVGIIPINSMIRYKFEGKENIAVVNSISVSSSDMVNLKQVIGVEVHEH